MKRLFLAFRCVFLTGLNALSGMNEDKCIRMGRNYKRDRKSERGFAPDPIKMKYYEMEFEGVKGLTFKERLDVLRKIGREADEKFLDHYLQLQDWFKSYDQLNLLSFSFYYFMTCKPGYDEEAMTGTLEFPPYYQELMQAFALTIPRSGNMAPFSRDVYRFKDSMKEVGELIKTKHFNLPDSATTAQEAYSHQLRTQVMLHTIAVRNWSYEDRMKSVTLGLAAAIKESFMAVHGFDPMVFLQVLYDMSEIVQENINAHRKNTITVVAARDYIAVFDTYEDLFPVVAETKEARDIMWERCGKDLKNLKGILLMHSDLFLHELFSFTYGELEVISGGIINAGMFKKILNKLSLVFGDLSDCDYEHFLMSNPVHDCPFIKVDEDTIFSTMWTVMTHFSIGILEKFCSEDERLRKKYNEARSKYLENAVEDLFRKSFPGAEVLVGSKWRGNDNKLYENDLLVIVDSFALIIEAKSGQVSPPAKRGAKERLFKTFRELIEEPSEQALRFIDYLKANPRKLLLSTEKGPDNIFDAGKIKYYIPLGITFSHLGMAGTNLKHLIRSGVTQKRLDELATSISLTDLEIIFDLLPLQMEKVHYLQRRRELEATIEFMGDEHDLLAWYLETGFNFEPTEKEYIYNMNLKSKELDNYIIGSANGEKVKKPYLQMTPWWRDMLERMEEKKFTTWAQSSYILLNFSIERQRYFERKSLKLQKGMQSKKAQHPHNWLSLDSAESERRFCVVSYYYNDEVREERHEVINEILDEQQEGKGNLVIGINVDKRHYPYSVLGSTLSSCVFDNRYLMMRRDNET